MRPSYLTIAVGHTSTFRGQSVGVGGRHFYGPAWLQGPIVRRATQAEMRRRAREFIAEQLARQPGASVTFRRTRANVY